MIHNSYKKGFTLVEMIVSFGIFIIVLFIATSAFFSIVNADRNSRLTRIATDNLNVVLEDISRRIKIGDSYDCYDKDAESEKDCLNGGTGITFKEQLNEQLDTLISYKKGLGSDPITQGSITDGGCGNTYSSNQGCVLRGDSNLFFTPVTSPEINIKNLKFIVGGSNFSDTQQPFVVIVIDGSLGNTTLNQAGKVGFKIQTTVTQRSYDK